MNGLEQISIKSFDMPQDDPELGIEIQLTSEIVNPSPIGVDMGDLEFDIFIPGNEVKMGEAFSSQVVLKPGLNEMVMKGRLVPFSSETDAKIISELFTTFLGGIDTRLLCVGRSIRPDKPVSWLNGAFVGLRLLVPFKGSANGNLIQSVSVGDMEMEFSSSNPYSPLLSVPSIQAEFEMPFNFNLTMKKVQQNITVKYEGRDLATITTPMLDAQGSSATKRMQTHLTKVPFHVFDNDDSKALFRKFLTSVTVGTASSFADMIGEAQVIAGSKIGDMHIQRLPFQTQVKMDGFHGLVPSFSPPSIQSVKVSGGDERGIEMQIVVKMWNPSNIKLSLGDVYFEMIYKQAKIGTVLVPKLVLSKGENILQTVARYNPQDAWSKETGLELLNRYSSRESGILVSCHGTRESTTLASLKDTMTVLKLTDLALPPIQEKMIIRTRFALTLSSLFESKTFAGMDLFNPFHSRVRIINIKASVTWTDKKSLQESVLGSINELLSPFTLEPRSETKAPQIPMLLNIGMEAIKVLH